MEDQKMGSMPINKLLLTMAAPMILSMMIGALYNIVDSIFVSNYSEDALTAVSLAFPIQNVIVALGTGVGVGINAMLSRLLGEKKQEEVNKTAGNGLLLSFIVYFVLLAFGIFGVKWFYHIQTTESSICSMGSAYLSIVCIFSFGQIFQLVVEKLLQSTGRTTYTMITQITVAVINIILDPILIFGYFGLPAMGITALRITSLSFIFACVSIMACYALQGLSIGTPSMIISAARQVIILLPVAYVFGKFFQVTGVWMAFPITEIIVMFIACIYLSHTLKKL